MISIESPEVHTQTAPENFFPVRYHVIVRRSRDKKPSETAKTYFERSHKMLVRELRICVFPDPDSPKRLMTKRFFCKSIFLLFKSLQQFEHSIVSVSDISDHHSSSSAPVSSRHDRLGAEERRVACLQIHVLLEARPSALWKTRNRGHAT